MRARLPFTKMHGAGNDFVVLDARSAGPGGLASASMARLAPRLAPRLAHRQTGIGCDQLVLLTDADAGDGADLAVRFFNGDGSEAGACGNATRCVAWLVSGGVGDGPALRLRTRGGLLTARVLADGQVEAAMGAPGLGWRDVPLSQALDTLHLPLPGDPAACSMGNPHATFFVTDDPIDPARQGPALEHDPLFPERANIGFARMVSRRRMRLRVWERGAGLTLACGSGACAAVVNAVRRGLAERRVTVELDGGTLDIAWGEDGIVRMTGPAELSFTGEILVDADALGDAAAGVSSLARGTGVPA